MLIKTWRKICTNLRKNNHIMSIIFSLCASYKFTSKNMKKLRNRLFTVPESITVINTHKNQENLLYFFSLILLNMFVHLFGLLLKYSVEFLCLLHFVSQYICLPGRVHHTCNIKTTITGNDHTS